MKLNLANENADLANLSTDAHSPPSKIQRYDPNSTFNKQKQELKLPNIENNLPTLTLQVKKVPSTSSNNRRRSLSKSNPAYEK